MEIYNINQPTIQYWNNIIIFDGFEFDFDDFNNVFNSPETLTRFECRLVKYVVPAYEKFIPRQLIEFCFNQIVNLFGEDFFFFFLHY